MYNPLDYATAVDPQLYDQAKAAPSVFMAWVAQKKATPLLAAVAVVIVCGAIKPARAFAVPIGVIIMALWFFKWDRKRTST